MSAVLRLETGDWWAGWRGLLFCPVLFEDFLRYMCVAWTLHLHTYVQSTSRGVKKRQN
jgi:hypothetical protein